MSESAVEVFISHAPEDRALLEELMTHLAILVRSGRIRLWHAGLVEPGQERAAIVAERLERAQVILLLVSAHFLHEQEGLGDPLERALARRRAGAARVIPVIADYCDWRATPLGELAVLPRRRPEDGDVRPVADWKSRGSVWIEVVKQLRELLPRLDPGPAPRPYTGPAIRSSAPPPPNVAPPAPPSPRVTLLFLGANPSSSTRLALGEEVREIDHRLRAAEHRDAFRIEQAWAVRSADLQECLLRYRPGIVHFSGHGSAKGQILLEGLEGRAVPIRPAALSKLFEILGRHVRCVVLNACYSEEQARAIVAHVDCVIGMTTTVKDAAAIAFAGAFYQALGFGEDVQTAFELGCNQMDLMDGGAMSARDLPQDGAEHTLPAGSAVPRLLVRAGLRARALRLFEPGRRSDLPPQPPPVEQEAAGKVSDPLADAQRRRDELKEAGASTAEVDLEIRELRRRQREGRPLRAGDTLGDDRYLLKRRIGSGGFGVVWLARDRQLQEDVAIKVLHANLAGDPVRLERFLRGARCMAELAHEAVVRVREPQGEEGGTHYYVMEYVPGGDLRRAVLELRLPEQRVIPVILRVTAALAAAHARGMVHRDVKPANILLDGEGEPRLTDFDLVGAVDTTGGTRTGAMGTFVYAAPELLDRPQDAGARADVYALGMTTMFCLRGAELPPEVLREPEEVLKALPCSEAVRGVLRRAIAWKPEGRFADARTFGEALWDAAEEGARERGGRTPDLVPPSRVRGIELMASSMPVHAQEDEDREAQRRRRKRMVIGLSVLAIVLGLAEGVFVLWRMAPEPGRATPDGDSGTPAAPESGELMAP